MVTKAGPDYHSVKHRIGKECKRKKGKLTV
jgi:hypothetical protein